MMKKIWAGVLGIAALLGITLGNAGESRVQSGGTEDRSVTHLVPVVISSADIESFRLDFQYDGVWEDGEKRNRYRQGEYSFCLEKAEDGAHCHIEWKLPDNDSRSADFTADASALSRLDVLLKEHDVAQLDGYWKSNSARGNDMQLDVLYAGGEKIHAFARGGASVSPWGKYYQETWFIDFFLDLAKEYGYDIFAPRLRKCVYIEENRETGGEYRIALQYNNEIPSRLVLEVMTRETKEGPESVRTREMSPESFIGLTEIAGRYDMISWRELLPRKGQEPKAERISLYLWYPDAGDGSVFGISSDLALPEGSGEGFREIREYLEALEETAPQ